MLTIILQSDDPENLQLISMIAKRLGAHVSEIADKLPEDIAFGNLMDNAKTGKSASRKAIIKKLRN